MLKARSGENLENTEKILNVLKEKVHRYCTPLRLNHIKGVSKLSRELARQYLVDIQETDIAAWAHDMFRDVSSEKLLSMARDYGINISDIEEKKPILLHGKLAAIYLKKHFDVDDEIFEAVYWHITGYPGLSILGKILMVADMAEEGRSFESARIIRTIAKKDLEEAFKNVIRLKVKWAVESGLFIPVELTMTWNYLLGGVSLGGNKGSQKE